MHPEPWVTIDVEVDILWTSLSCSLHAEKHGTDLRALLKGMCRCRSLCSRWLSCQLARSFIGPSASVLSRARRTTTKNPFKLVLWQMRSCAALKCESANFWQLLNRSAWYNDAIHLRHNELCFLFISGSILRRAEGLSLVHTLPEFRSSVPFGADASPVPHGGQGSMQLYVQW